VRTLLDIVVAVLLIAVGWEKSFKERAGELPWIGDKLSSVPKAPDHSRSSTVHPHPTPTASGAWMWDTNRKSVLDAPAKNHPTVTPH
jgi:hypothetical protein